MIIVCRRGRPLETWRICGCDSRSPGVWPGAAVVSVVSHSQYFMRRSSKVAFVPGKKDIAKIMTRRRADSAPASTLHARSSRLLSHSAHGDGRNMVMVAWSISQPDGIPPQEEDSPAGSRSPPVEVGYDTQWREREMSFAMRPTESIRTPETGTASLPPLFSRFPTHPIHEILTELWVELEKLQTESSCTGTESEEASSVASPSPIM